jgi:hypothetical protein
VGDAQRGEHLQAEGERERPAVQPIDQDLVVHVDAVFEQLVREIPVRVRLRLPLLGVANLLEGLSPLARGQLPEFFSQELLVLWRKFFGHEYIKNDLSPILSAMAT